MKTFFIILCIAISLLSACKSSTLSLSEIENVPNNVQDKIDSNLTLQSINDEKGSYIIFHSSGNVKADLTTEGDTVTIRFNVTNSKDEAVIQNVYYLTTDTSHEVIEVHMNGKSIPFENITSTSKTHKALFVGNRLLNMRNSEIIRNNSLFSYLEIKKRQREFIIDL